MKRKILIASAVSLAAAAAGGLTYYQLVKAGVLRYNRFDRREKGSLAVGDAAPDLALTLYEGSSIQLSQLWNEKPVLLIFGSCT